MLHRQAVFRCARGPRLSTGLPSSHNAVRTKRGSPLPNGRGGASRTVALGPPQRTEAMPSLVVTVPTFWRRSASPSVFNSSRSSTVWLRSRVPSAVAIGETM